MTITREQLDRCHKLALDVAPELSERPLYVVDAAELGGLPRLDCFGWAIPRGIDYNVRAALGARWTEPGPVIVLDGDAIADRALPGAFDRCLCNVLLHEVAHIVPPSPTCVEVDPTPMLLEYQRATLESELTAPPVPPGSAGDPHDLRFLRRCLHLWVRAALAGVDVPLHRLANAHAMQTSEVHYLPLILREAIAMRDATFFEIESAPAPPLLVAQWDADVQVYHEVFSKSRT